MSIDPDERQKRRAIALLQARNELQQVAPEPRRFLLDLYGATAVIVIAYLALGDGDWTAVEGACVTAVVLLGYQLYTQLKAAERRVQIVVTLLEELED